MKIKTVLAALVGILAVIDAFSQTRSLKDRIAVLRIKQADSQQSVKQDEMSGQEKIPGVTAPLISYPEKDKIKYEDAVERAKKNDAEAFYWLSYYFGKGEKVPQDWRASAKFLQRAADVGSAKANYLIALHHECYTLRDAYGECLRYSYTGYFDSLFSETIICDNPFFVDFFRKPEVPKGVSAIQWYCCTNEIVSQFVIDIYSVAVKGGLVYATNDIARLKQTIAKCRERIASKNAAQAAAQANGEMALKLLGEEDSKKIEAKERERQEEERERQREYWSTWPRSLVGETYAQLIFDLEEKFNCIFAEQYRFRGRGLRMPIFDSGAVDIATNTWRLGCGKSLVVKSPPWFNKVDADGKIVAWGLLENSSDLEELKYYDEEYSRRLDALKENWAKERGMTLEEAKRKYDEQNSLRPASRLLNTLHGRRTARERKTETEMRAEREAREEQRKQLQAIREELRKAREERAAKERDMR